MKYHGRSALITGASSGVGEALARALAQRGMGVLLTALPEDHSRLTALANELTARHEVRTEVVTLDLSEQDAPRCLQAAADDLGFEPDLLVNSAGVGVVGPFAQVPIERQLRTVRLNIEALVTLTGLYLPRMVARREGAVLNIASTAALRPVPHFAVYAASKAFVLSFGEALWAECHRHGVRVVTLCPGPIGGTRFGSSSPPAPTGALRFMPEMPSIPMAVVVASALQALENDHPRVVKHVPRLGLAVRFTAHVGSLAPLRLSLLTAERLSRWFFRLD